MTVSLFAMCCLMVLVSRISCKSHNKRLVLHSDVDMAAAIQTLTERLETLSAVVEQLSAQNKQLVSEVQTVNAQNRQLVADVQTLKTTSFGGFSGGNMYDKNGAADYICLSGDPLWGAYDDSAQAYTLKIYGTEYQFSDQFSDGGVRFFGRNLYDHDAPCAVCRSSRPTTVMIPGRNQCYPGWTMEYAGYLVSGASEFAAPSNYACLDANAEWELGDVENKNGKLMFLVEAACGSLKCPPYVQNREITCVVCSK